jgi:hypothetical protein
VFDSSKLQDSIRSENLILKRINSSPSWKYKKNFTFSYDAEVIAQFKKQNPAIVQEYRGFLLKKEPWLKYQEENLVKKLNQMILPSVLEKREGVSRKDVGADLKHLSYSESHSRVKNGGDSTKSSDINFGTHTTLDGIVGESQKTVYIEHVDETVVFDPCLVDTCLEQLKRDNGKIKDCGLEEEISNMYNNKVEMQIILERYNGIDQKDLLRYINNIQDYEVICMFYSLRGFKKTTQEQIAAMFNITQPAVIKRINRAKNRFLEIYIKEAKNSGNEFFPGW